MVDKDGRGTYSGIVLIVPDRISTAISISPNPAHDFLILTTGAPRSTLTLADLSGRILVKHSNRDAGIHRVNTSGLAKGVYVVTIASDGVIFQKIVID